MECPVVRLLPSLSLAASAPALAGASGGATLNGGTGFLTPGPVAPVVVAAAVAALALYRNRRK